MKPRIIELKIDKHGITSPQILSFGTIKAIPLEDVIQMIDKKLEEVECRRHPIVPKTECKYCYAEKVIKSILKPLKDKEE